MADLGLAIVGILPVLAASVKGFKILRGSIRTAKKCIKHLEDIDLNVETQEVRFLNECKLVLRQTGKFDSECTAMIGDPSHAGWSMEEAIEGSIRQHLGSTYEVCCKIVRRIVEIIEEARNELDCFDMIRKERQPGESWKLAFQRRSQALHLVFDKANIKKIVQSLRVKIDDLEGLRQQIKQIKDDDATSAQVTVTNPVSPQLIKVRQISREVYNALSASFRCEDADHHEHQVFLGLDVELVSDVSLSMALTYSTACSSDTNEEPPVRFMLRSQTVWSPDNNGRLTQSSIVGVTTITSPTKSPDKVYMPSQAKPQSKRPRVMFAGADSDDSDFASEAAKRPQTVAASGKLDGAVAQLTGPTFDLSAISSPCHFLRQNCGRRTSRAACSSYIASLKLPEASRHVFYISACDTKIGQKPPQPSSIPSISLFDYVKSTSKDNVVVDQQYKLALRLARAVLQYHSTPWLQEDWTINQLQVMLSGSEDDEDLPLYLSLKLMGNHVASSAKHDDTTNDVQMANTTKLPLTRAQKYGIHNLPLFCLGTALLEIGHWKSASELFDAEIDDNLVDTVRRLAFAPAKLGKFYDKIISKCLRCNFGDQTDLSRVDLVKSVYDDVVCPLEDLVRKLDGLGL